MISVTRNRIEITLVKRLLLPHASNYNNRYNYVFRAHTTHHNSITREMPGYWFHISNGKDRVIRDLARGLGVPIDQMRAAYTRERLLGNLDAL